MTQQQKEPHFIHSIVVFFPILFFISIGLFAYKLSLHVLILISLFWVGMHAWLIGCSYTSIQKMMYSAIHRALPAISIFLLIGVVIAALMHSGAIASLIYYGLGWLSPAMFLPLGLMLCALMSLATGTAWGTVGTLGVVFIGIGATMNIPLPIVAGMVVCGATFGDKLSPVSDTTNLAAMATEVNLYTHIRSMLYTTVPAFGISIGVFWYLGTAYAGATYSVAEVAAVRNVLQSVYHLNPWITFIPFVVMLGLSIYRFSAELSMSFCVLSAVLVAVFYQQTDAITVLNALWENKPQKTGMVKVDELLGKGGLSSMSWTLLLSLLALAMGGVLHGAGFLRVLVWGMVSRVQKLGSLVASTIGFGLLGNLAMGEAYITILLNSQIFKSKFAAHEINPAVLSRSVEEGATLTTGLIPWTTAGAFYASTLGVDVLAYLPYAVFNYINPLIGIAFAYLGIAVFKKKVNL